MNTIEDLRPEIGPLDPEWSASTLQAILAERAAPIPRASAPSGHRSAAGSRPWPQPRPSPAQLPPSIVTLRPDAAFAVERHPDGDVVITVMKLADSAGLERALAREGITAEVTYDSDAVVSTDQANGADPACWPGVGDVVVDPADNGGVSITLAADYVASHDGVLQLTAAGGRSADDWIGASVSWC